MPAGKSPASHAAQPSARRRQRRQLIVISLLLLLAAVLLMVLPLRLPWLVRFALAILDLAGACALWLFSRQQLSDR